MQLTQFRYKDNMIISKIGESNNVFSLRTPHIINLLYL